MAINVLYARDYSDLKC